MTATEIPTVVSYDHDTGVGASIDLEILTRFCTGLPFGRTLLMPVEHSVSELCEMGRTGRRVEPDRSPGQYL